jgi:hypothetical protein
MAFSNFTRIVLYVIAGISLLVILFFYVGPKTVNYAALEAKVDEVMNPADLTPAALPAVDTTAADSLASDSTMVAGPEVKSQDPFATATVSDTSGKNLKEALSGWEYLVWFRTDIALVWAYILLILSLLGAVVFPLISVVTNTKALVRLLLVLGGAAVLVVVSWLASSDAPIEIIGYTGTDNSNPAILKMIDTGLFVTYLLFGMALASILYAIISRAFK